MKWNLGERDPCFTKGIYHLWLTVDHFVFIELAIMKA